MFLNVCLKSDRFFGGGGSRYQQEQLEPSPSHFENTALWVYCLAASTVTRWPWNMSEKRGEVIVLAGRRYQQKQLELLPAAKGLNF